jgi:hypothetical protein
VANGHGGYREPAHPAAVSGPGSFAKRTDGGPTQVQSVAPDQGYGDAQQQHQAESTAPMAGTNPLPPAAQAQAQPGQGQPALASAAPYGGGAFAAPSTRPNEPVTAGAALGPGPGPEVLPAVSPSQNSPATGAMTQLLSRLMSTDTTGVLSALLQQAQARGA